MSTSKRILDCTIVSRYAHRRQAPRELNLAFIVFLCLRNEKDQNFMFRLSSRRQLLIQLFSKGVEEGFSEAKSVPCFASLHIKAAFYGCYNVLPILGHVGITLSGCVKGGSMIPATAGCVEDIVSDYESLRLCSSHHQRRRAK